MTRPRTSRWQPLVIALSFIVLVGVIFVETMNSMTNTDDFLKIWAAVEGHEQYPAEAVTELGKAMSGAPKAHPTPEGENDVEENRGTAVDSGITAAYTYLGQFIDHDLTIDLVSSLHGRPLWGLGQRR